MREVQGKESFLVVNTMENPANALWTLAYFAMVFTAVVGNATVAWIVVGHKRMWTTTNAFLLHLSLVDLLGAIFNTIFNFISMKDR